MSKIYDPTDWYWQRDDGSLFSSRRIATVLPSDSEYQAWAADGSVPTRYPRDEKGGESETELQVALDGFNLHATLGHYVGAVRYDAETSGVTVKILGKTVPMSTRREDRDGMRDTMLAIVSGIRDDGANFKFDDGVLRPAKNTEMTTAIQAAFSHVQSAYDREADVQAELKKGTLKTKSDVEARFADLK